MHYKETGYGMPAVVDAHIRHTSVIPIAGDQITNDIAMALRTPTREAEDIKCKFGCALSQLADMNESLDVAGVDDRPSRKLSRRALADVIQPRVEELFELIQNELRRAGFEEVLSSGIVLTGGASVRPLAAVPTKPPVATVSPSRIRDTASLAETILPVEESCCAMKISCKWGESIRHARSGHGGNPVSFTRKRQRGPAPPSA